MECSCCGKAAKRYTVNSAKGECAVVLCADCYKRLYGKTVRKFEEAKEAQKECPACGTTYDDFKRTGLVGCAECYRVFRDELIPVLGYLQRGVRHTGTVPVDRGEEEYDKLRALIVEQERLWEAYDRAVEAGDGKEQKRVIDRLEEIRGAIQRREED